MKEMLIADVKLENLECILRQLYIQTLKIYREQSNNQDDEPLAARVTTSIVSQTAQFLGILLGVLSIQTANILRKDMLKFFFRKLIEAESESRKVLEEAKTLDNEASLEKNDFFPT